MPPRDDRTPVVRASRDEKMYFYDRFAAQFECAVNMYDTTRRLDVVFDELLAGEPVQGSRLLDAGSGLGWFSKRAAARGARVVSLDVGVNILRKVAEKCRTDLVVGSACELNFRDASFDIVVSSEVIEHTPDPRRAVRELCRIVKPGGLLVLTVPNRIWHFAAVAANALKIRPYEGYENWVGWWELQRWLREDGMTIEACRGIHLFPFVLRVTHPLLRFLDRYGRSLGPVMVNIAVKARKGAITRFPPEPHQIG